ncbi:MULTISPECIES: Holliday junction branch migration protein RuvA [Glaesserella]|uniref:Holliday junction branch migration complex subunit RuvA n=1 Tax=Glaesserella australis TaxID=2094024 RepID=A0A328BWP4_9PAST|nr:MULTISPECIES: Holliday junction branch migration protein RuvA [Glaesserella]AUI65321.1 Holliday junction branch migration protein RuvA [Glaesserella sp. 15-184]RAL18593.1 Holliday junction branch migration protein RuvA [Glaesserella australis]
MIGRLHGKIIEKSPPEMVLDVQGVGYELLLPMTSFYSLPAVNEEVTIFTHLVVREDAHLLFGFAQKQDRTLFRELIKTNGVGPKLALAILSAMSVSQFATAVEQEELAKLTKIPGIGRKTAERLLVELKGKFKGMAQSDFFVEQSSETHIVASESNDPATEAAEALVALGYKPADAEKMIKKLNKSGMTSEQLIREALKNAL